MNGVNGFIFIIFEYTLNINKIGTSLLDSVILLIIFIIICNITFLLICCYDIRKTCGP